VSARSGALSIICLLLLISPSRGFSTTAVHAATPTCGHVGTLLGVVVLNAHDLTGSTDAGSLAYSTDGGKCWSAGVVAGGGAHRLGTFVRDPRRPGVLLAGSGSPGRVGFGDTTGLLRSTDDGKHWTTLRAATGLPNPSFVVDDLITVGNALYAAISCPDEVAAIASQQPGPFQCGAPIYRSRDDGATWQAAGLGAAQPTGDQPAPAFDGAVQALTAQGSSIFAAAIPLYSSPGIYRSDNAGGSWRLTGTSRGLEDVTTLIALPGTTVPILLAGAGIVGAGAQILRSTAAGRSWTTVLAAAKFNDPVALQFLSTKHGLYCLGLHHLFLSTDSGVTWQPTAGIGLGTGLNSRLAELPSGALLLTQTGMIVTSVDGGAHWRRLE
jgi:photosystem II stability/assembly factor-like uncharacterized protein